MQMHQQCYLIVLQRLQMGADQHIMQMRSHFLQRFADKDHYGMLQAAAQSTRSPFQVMVLTTKTKHQHRLSFNTWRNSLLNIRGGCVKLSLSIYQAFLRAGWADRKTIGMWDCACRRCRCNRNFWDADDNDRVPVGQFS